MLNVIREMQIITTKEYKYTPTRMEIKKTDNIKNWEDMN